MEQTIVKPGVAVEIYPILENNKNSLYEINEAHGEPYPAFIYIRIIDNCFKVYAEYETKIKFNNEDTVKISIPPNATNQQINDLFKTTNFRCYIKSIAREFKIEFKNGKFVNIWNEKHIAGLKKFIEQELVDCPEPYKIDDFLDSVPTEELCRDGLNINFIISNAEDIISKIEKFGNVFAYGSLRDYIDKRMGIQD